MKILLGMLTVVGGGIQAGSVAKFFDD